MNARAALSALAASLVLAACATPPQTAALRARGADAAAARQRELPVPFFPQEAEQCGPASLAMAMNWAGRNVTPEALQARVYLPGRHGSLAADLTGATRRAGLLALAPAGGLQGLLTQIDAGHPVVVLQNLGLWWYPVWHFAVVIGYDLDEGSLVLHSGPQARLHLSMATFERTWDRADDWALVVLPPDDAADVFAPAAVLAAAALLEPSAPTAAEAAYRSQLPRAPATAWLGLGNLAMAAGRPAEAAQDYRQALAHDNKLADAWNNLAEAELTVGHLGEAGAAIARAQALGGPHAGAYADTAASVASAAAAAAAASAPAATQDRAPTR